MCAHGVVWLSGCFRYFYSSVSSVRLTSGLIETRRIPSDSTPSNLTNGVEAEIEKKRKNNNMRHLISNSSFCSIFLFIIKG